MKLDSNIVTRVQSYLTRCVRCEHCSGGATQRSLTCSQMGGASIVKKLQSMQPFCPLGRHDDAPIEMRMLVGRDALLAMKPRGWRVTWGRIRFRLRRLFEGASKLAIAAAFQCRAFRDARLTRRRQCAACEHRGSALLVLATCRQCGCLARAKTALATERCPVGKWPAVVGARCNWLSRVPWLWRFAVAKETGGCGGGCGH